MIIPIILASLSSSISWQEIDLKQKLMLNNSISLNDAITLKAGTQTSVTELINLDAINVLQIKMNITPCKRSMSQLTSEMIIVNDLYGVELEKNCTLNIFLEYQDIHENSFFSI